MSLKPFLVVALIVAFGVIILLWRKLYKLRNESKHRLRELGMRRATCKKIREVESLNSRLVRENLDLRSLLGASQVKDIPRSTFGQGVMLETKPALQSVKKI